MAEACWARKPKESFIHELESRTYEPAVGDWEPTAVLGAATSASTKAGWLPPDAPGRVRQPIPEYRTLGQFAALAATGDRGYRRVFGPTFPVGFARDHDRRVSAHPALPEVEYSRTRTERVDQPIEHRRPLM